jgi:hypothetical protein
MSVSLLSCEKDGIFEVEKNSDLGRVIFEAVGLANKENRSIRFNLNGVTHEIIPGFQGFSPPKPSDC